MSQTWETLVAMALLGTDRQGTLPTITEETIKPVLEQLNTEDMEGWVLSAAGTLAAYRQAGQKGVQGMKYSIDPCESDNSISFCSDSLSLLRSILDPDFQTVLPEFLSLLQQTGQYIPPEYLPKLLDWGCAHTEVRSPLRSVIGRRGQWLARLNPKWAYAQATPEAPNPEDWQSLWETSDRTVRLNLLREWRSQNAEAAHELLASTWKQETARDRAEFLACFEQGLSLADEAFLEKVLGDRSKDVKAIAIELLAKLPDSQLSQRVATQASELIRFTVVEGKLQGEITLPKTDDSQWKNYEFKPQYFGQFNSKRGDRANLLIQILSITPLSAWEKAGSPEQLIHAVANHDWGSSVIQGWSLACQQQRNSTWANALLRALGQNSSFQLYDVGAVEMVAPLLLLLPIEARYQWITDWLDPQGWQNGTLHLLSDTLPVPWSLELSQILLSSAQSYIETCNTSDDKELFRVKRVVTSHLRSMAYRLHHNSLETSEASQLRCFYDEDSASELEKFSGILEFRQRMYQTILRNGEPSG